MARLLIVGAGRMAEAHVLAARALGHDVNIATRSRTSAASIERTTGIVARAGGLDAWLRENPAPKSAIVAVSVSELARVTIGLIEAGAKRILLEKPGGIDAQEISDLARAADQASATVLLGYNRRHYRSVRLAKEIIGEDGGLSSIRFDFTEVAGNVQASSHPPEVKRAWFLANSSHVVDLAFFLAGEPRILSAVAEGGLAWHPAARFSGCGTTASDASYSYHADWIAPGRWSIDARTPRRRLLLEPLEAISVQRHGSFELKALALPEPEHASLKEGVLEQLHAFLDGQDADFVDIATQAKRARGLYRHIVVGTEGSVAL
jgi:predicted dehydrogenase